MDAISLVIIAPTFDRREGVKIFLINVEKLCKCGRVETRANSMIKMKNIENLVRQIQIATKNSLHS